MGLYCNICEREFAHESSRSRHNCEEAEKYSCDICQKQFKRKDNLKRHENSKKPCKPIESFPCTICEKELLTRHVKNVHCKPKKSFPCNNCEKVFNYRRLLTTHMKSHKKETNYVSPTVLTPTVFIPSFPLPSVQSCSRDLNSSCSSGSEVEFEFDESIRSMAFERESGMNFYIV